MDGGPFGPWSVGEAVADWAEDDPIFAVLDDLDVPAPAPRIPSGLPPAFEEIEWIFRVMGSHGWSPVEVDEMELWQIARFLGLGADRPAVVIRGSRALTLKTDAPGSGGEAPPMGNIAERAAEAKARHEARRAKG